MLLEREEIAPRQTPLRQPRDDVSKTRLSCGFVFVGSTYDGRRQDASDYNH
jgi:hypothetical protein